MNPIERDFVSGQLEDARERREQNEMEDRVQNYLFQTSITLTAVKDMLLGEDAVDRSNKTLCRAVKRLHAKLRGRAEIIRRLQEESDANRREAESCGRFELRFVEELDAIKAAVKFEETADSDGPVTLVQWCGRMAAENDRLQAIIDAQTSEWTAATEVIDTQQAEINRLHAASERLTECDLESIDWYDRTITLRYPAGIDGLEVRAGLKIKADLSPMQPDPDTEPPVSDQTSIL